MAAAVTVDHAAATRRRTWEAGTRRPSPPGVGSLAKAARVRVRRLNMPRRGCQLTDRPSCSRARSTVTSSVTIFPRTVCRRPAAGPAAAGGQRRLAMLSTQFTINDLPIEIILSIYAHCSRMVCSHMLVCRRFLRGLTRSKTIYISIKDRSPPLPAKYLARLLRRCKINSILNCKRPAAFICEL